MEKAALFSNLIAPGRVGSLSVRNRMAMPPMCSHFGTRDGYVTQRSIDYYSARACGGVGLLCVEIAAVDSIGGKCVAREFGVDHDKFLPGLSEVADVIKRGGARAWLQLHHAGRETFDWNPEHPQPVAPSAIAGVLAHIPAPRPLAVAEIEDIAGRFVDGAVRARRAGFEGVELHAAHGYLLAQFLSPLSNHRRDDYGGPLANRARLLLDIVRAIKQRLGSDYPLSVRLSAEEDLPGGVSIEEMCEVARWLERAGADLLSVSKGATRAATPVVVPPAWYERGFLMPLVAKIREAVTVPVIGVGRLNTPQVAEEALRNGQCDFVGLGRALIADPEFPNKVASGRADEIRNCVACMHCLAVLRIGGIACALNPAAGREREAEMKPAAQRKKVFVIGGGPAGMEAARVAALRGHDVTLFERSDRLGGQLNAAFIPPHKSEFELLRRYYVGQMLRRGVKTCVCSNAEANAVSAAKPDALIVATGSRPRIPAIPGIAGPNVVAAEDVLLGRRDTGARVIVMGGELIGCETAEYLAVRGKQVIVTRRSQQPLASTMNNIVRPALLDRLKSLGVQALTGVDYQEVNARGLVVTTAEGELRLLEADTVVIAAGSKAVDELSEDLRGQLTAIEVVGDAVEPRRLLEAIREGMAAGLTV